MKRLEVQAFGVTFRNPILLASGTWSPRLNELYPLSMLGGLVTKTITVEPCEGNPPPRIWETEHGVLNSIGLENPGIDRFMNEVLPELFQLNPIIIVSIAGSKPEEFYTLVERLNPTNVTAYEINVSCPNVARGGIELGKDTTSLLDIARNLRELSHKPLIYKLSIVHDIDQIVPLLTPYADGFTLINSVPAMAIDLQTRRSQLGNITGGLSGPSIKPIALYAVHKARKLTHLPIVGCGGVSKLEDVLEFISVGASLVQVGSANFNHPLIGKELVEGSANLLNNMR